MGLNRSPNIRGIAIKGLLKDLSCKQQTRGRAEGRRGICMFVERAARLTQARFTGPGSR